MVAVAGDSAAVAATSVSNLSHTYIFEPGLASQHSLPPSNSQMLYKGHSRQCKLQNIYRMAIQKTTMCSKM
jgi:hypothetical protein